MDPYYFISLGREYKDIPSVEKAIENLENYNPEFDWRIGYYMPQPEYKSWVPKWLIRFITKK